MLFACSNNLHRRSRCLAVQEIDVSEGFALYCTTRLPNPKFTPELSGGPLGLLLECCSTRWQLLCCSCGGEGCSTASFSTAPRSSAHPPPPTAIHPLRSLLTLCSQGDGHRLHCDPGRAGGPAAGPTHPQGEERAGEPAAAPAGRGEGESLLSVVLGWRRRGAAGVPCRCS